MKKVSFALFAFVALASSVAFAEVKTDADAKIQYNVPTGWKFQQQGNSAVMGDPNDEVAVLIIHGEGKDMNAATAAADAQLKKQIPDLKPTGNATPGKQNGMDAIHIKAEGTWKEAGKPDKPVKVGMVIFKTPAGKFVIVVAIVDAKLKDKHNKDVTDFVYSIKPVS